MYSLGLYEKAMPSDLCFSEMLDVTARCGFDHLEISIDETDERLARLEWSDREKHSLYETARACGVPIKTMCLSGHRKYPLGSHESSVRLRSLEMAKKAIDFSAEVGVRVIQLAGYDVYYEEHDAFTEAMFLENLTKTVEFAAKSGVVLAFETMETPFMDTVAKAMKYVREVGSAWLGLYPDIGNLQNAAVLYGSDVTEDLMGGAGHIYAMHLKETRPQVYRNMRFGTGHTRYEDCLSCAVRQRVGLFTGEFWYQGRGDYIAEISRAAQFLRRKIERVYPRGGEA